MDGYNHRSKRRRLDPSPVRPNGFVKSPTESSSDELAAGSEHDEAERRRASWSIQKAVPPKRPYRRSRSYSGSESPDELTMDAEDYWRSRGRGRKSPSEVSAEPSSEQYPDEGEGEGEGEDAEEEEEGVEAEEEDAGAEGDAEDVEIEDVEEIPADIEEPEAAATDDADAAPEQLFSDRSPTPVPPPPPPPPPKPDKLNYQQKFLLRGHLRGVSAVQFSPDASMIASGGADGAVKVWDTQSGRLIHTFEGHLAGVSTISWGPDGAIIASGSDDKTIRLWNVLTGKAHPIPFVGHHNYVYQIAFSPKGNMLASGSYDEAVFLWDVRSASVMRSLPAHSDPVGGIDMVWDGTLVASCATDGLIRIWDTATGQCLRTLVHEDNPPVTAVKFSPNGKYVLAWTLDDCVRLWNYVEGRCIKTYQGHSNRKYSLSGGFGVYGAPGAPPEAFAVSGSEDGAVLCWDVVNKKILQRIEGHVGVVLGVDTASLGEQRLMVSCGIDGLVRVYEEREEEDQGQEGDADAGEEQQPNGTGETTANTEPQADMAPEADMEPEAPTGEPKAVEAQTNGVTPTGASDAEPQDTEMGEADTPSG